MEVLGGDRAVLPGKVGNEGGGVPLEVMEQYVDGRERSGADEHAAQVPHARGERESIEGGVTDRKFVGGHGTKRHPDRFLAQPSHHRAWVARRQQVVMQGGKAGMDAAALVCEDVTETLGQPTGAALGSGELYLASAGDAREPWGHAGAGRADDASDRVVEGQNLDLIALGAASGVSAEP